MLLVSLSGACPHSTDVAGFSGTCPHSTVGDTGTCGSLDAPLDAFFHKARSRGHTWKLR